MTLEDQSDWADLSHPWESRPSCLTPEPHVASGHWRFGTIARWVCCLARCAPDSPPAQTFHSRAASFGDPCGRGYQAARRSAFITYPSKGPCHLATVGVRSREGHRTSDLDERVSSSPGGEILLTTKTNGHPKVAVCPLSDSFEGAYDEADVNPGARR